MNRHQLKLRRELSQVGAKPAEIEELTSIAKNLSSLRENKEGRVWVKALKPVTIAVLSLAVGAIIIMVAQSVSPTSLLYPVQKLSDTLAIDANSNYRVTVMMRRAQQVNYLVANHASNQVILSTLNSYNQEAASYKTMSNHSYAALEYCKSNLTQAAALASVNIRRSITDSLNSLANT